MEKVALILDPAHGINVPGKASPDRRLEEWDWSRERIRSIIELLGNFTKEFIVESPFLQFDMEPGIRERVDHYNELCSGYDQVYVLSLHVDAAPKNLLDRNGWADDITGTTIFTSRGETLADDFATELGQGIRSIQPLARYRFDFGLGKDEFIRDLDRERNFTVLAGYRKSRSCPLSAPHNWIAPKYHGVLIENGFMTSKKDLNLLLDPKWCEDREIGICKGILNWFHTMGLAPKFF